ncbi:unnamed protein product [Rotaria sp. Silwood1]|nr:unnamed protein product [Rotaria sp. Silwood1]CAF5071253.1 unnamed protein product [Rotaria sp. Silwood1]
MLLEHQFFEEPLQYRLIECISNENETLSKNILELFNINETCVKVNKSSSSGDEIYFYILPETETNIQIQITTDDCSLPLPELYLSLCYDQYDYNHTEIMVTYPYQNLTSIHTLHNYEYTSTTESIFSTDSTDPTIYETLHYLDHNSDEDSDSDSDSDSNSNSNSNSNSDSDSNEHEYNITGRPASFIDEVFRQMDFSSEDID